MTVRELIRSVYADLQQMCTLSLAFDFVNIASISTFNLGYVALWPAATQLQKGPPYFDCQWPLVPPRIQVMSLF